MPGDIEKAKRELRSATFAADDKRWDDLEAKLQAIDTALEGVPDAEKAPIAAEVAAMREKMLKAVREEAAARLEREIKRTLSAAADDLDRGYDESPRVPKAIARLEEAKELLSAETVAALQAEIAALEAKSKKAAPPPPKPAAPAPSVVAAPAVPPPPSSATPAAAPVENERAKAIESEVARIVGRAVDEVGGNPDRFGRYLEQLHARLESDEARQNLSPETMQRLQAQVAELEAKFAAAEREKKVREHESIIDRHLRSGESAISYDRRSAENSLRNASEWLERDDAKQLLSSESVARFRSEIDRVQALIQAAAKKFGLERALPVLQELEERVQKPIFDGSQPAWRVVGDLDALKSRVRAALWELPGDDADLNGVEARIAAVDDTIAAATAKLDRDQAYDRVKQDWELELKEITGWEAESGGEAAHPTYQLNKTTSAIMRTRRFLEDKAIKEIEASHKDDKPIQDLLAEARKIRDAAIAKLHAAFNALLTHLEQQPRPSTRADLWEPHSLAVTALGDFEGTPHQEANATRAKALGERWEKEVEAERKARQAKYDELSAKAAAAWPKIRSSIEAQKEFDPQDSGFKGRTVLVEELRNRIGWDFAGPYDFAIWVNGYPVFGNYDPAVLAAVNESWETTGLPLDDHTDWDAVIVVGGPGKIKLRTEIIIRDRGNLEIGKIEEWRPVDAVTCTVVALRAGPVAIGPKE